MHLVGSIAALLLLLVLAGVIAAGRSRPRTRLQVLREAYAHDQISLLELERGVEEALAAGNPRVAPSGDRSKPRFDGRLALVPIALAGTVVALVPVVRDAPLGVRIPSPTQRSWAERANSACQAMAVAYRTEAKLHRQVVVGLDDEPFSLAELAEIRRQAVLMQSAAASRIRALGKPPSPDAASAIEAWEQKIQLERRASEEGARGNRRAWEALMRQTVTPGIEANRAFAAAGATACSGIV